MEFPLVSRRTNERAISLERMNVKCWINIDELTAARSHILKLGNGNFFKLIGGRKQIPVFAERMLS